ncbi:hypothetical protein [Bacillus sp. NPDC094106]|uniref:hypothetical protein n=1 Tax=Bacillus sp. NPDC094106 TaxID=3363949 RepID=UPI00380416EF
MRKPKVINKYNLTFADVKKLEIVDREKVGEPLFWRNQVVGAWCISDTTVKNQKDYEYGAYNSFWIGIYDEESKRKKKLDVTCHAYGGMCNYTFSRFFDEKGIQNKDDLEIQEKLLSKINELIDAGILVIKKRSDN